MVVEVLVAVQLLSHVWLFAIAPTVAWQDPVPSLSPGVCSDSGPLSQWTHPTISSSVALFLSCPQSFPASGSFPTDQDELAFCIRWPKNWSFSFRNSPSDKYSGFISFRIDSFDLLVQKTLNESLLQHHSSKASILWCSAFFMVQLSYPYMEKP